MYFNLNLEAICKNLGFSYLISFDLVQLIDL